MLTSRMPIRRKPVNPRRREPLPREDLGFAVVSGDAHLADRLRWAVQHGPRPYTSIKAIATAIGAHPSALTPSNFKLSVSAGREAARLLAVPPGFLAEHPILPDDLPETLMPEWRAIGKVRDRAKRLGGGWLPEANLAALRPERTDPPLVLAAFTYLREQALRLLDSPAIIELTRGRWCEILEQLAEGAVAAGADLHDRRYRVAKLLHSAIKES